MVVKQLISRLDPQRLALRGWIILVLSIACWLLPIAFLVAVARQVAEALS